MYNFEEFDKQKTKVMKYIVFKKRTEQEVRTKFENLIENNMLEDIIEYLKEANYLNDKEYIQKVVNEYKLLKNLSLKELKYKLLTKGLNKDDIEDYIYENKDELKEYEIKSARNILNKKRKELEEEKIKQYLMQKGYCIDSVKEAMNEE